MPFDLSLLDRDANRKHRRKKYFTYFIGPMILTVLVALYAILPWIASNNVTGAYKNKKFETDNVIHTLSGLTSIEKSAFYYNSGTMMSARKDYERAISDFEKALGYLDDTTHPLFCKITINLVLSYEKWADELVYQQKQPIAIERYIKALSYINDRLNCFEDRKDQERIEAKLKAVRDAEVGRDDQNSDRQKEQTPSKSDKEQIEKREQEAQRQRSNDKRSNEDTDSDYSADYKQW